MRLRYFFWPLRTGKRIEPLLTLRSAPLVSPLRPAYTSRFLISPRYCAPAFLAGSAEPFGVLVSRAPNRVLLLRDALPILSMRFVFVAITRESGGTLFRSRESGRRSC